MSRYFIVLFVLNVTRAFALDVSGVVLDSETKEPVIGATVLEKGAHNGVAADLDGKFVLKGVADSAVLMVSSVGYSAKEVPAAANLNILLDLKPLELDEVSVIGCGKSELVRLNAATAQYHLGVKKCVPMTCAENYVLVDENNRKYEFSLVCKNSSINSDDCKNSNPNVRCTKQGDLDAIYSKLRDVHDKFRGDVSVWKNASGEFNTARLSSDMIAGVVLGTAGGLVTSHVVKKNQVEDGFEKIKCVIGGQELASWGDEFRVGFR